MWSIFRSTALVACTYFAVISPALANDKCQAITQWLQVLLAQRTAAGNFYTLRTNGEAQFILFMEDFHKDVRPKQDMLYAPWGLLARDTSRDPSVYCEIGHGKRVEVLHDAHDANTAKKFGLPGSGYPRCSNNVLDAIQLRLWANEELGDSYIFYMGDGELKSSTYTFLISTDGRYWILLEDIGGDAAHQCYRARGDDTLIDTFSAPKPADSAGSKAK